MPKSLRDQLTILVLTYNRYPFLLRLLRYYQAWGVRCSVHLLDSSQETAPAALPSLVQAMGIQHRRYDPQIPPTVKMAEGAQAVTTPYAVFWADDDFLVCRAFEAMVHHLETHPDASMVHGHSRLFRVREEGRGRALMDLGGYPPRAYAHPKASQRVCEYLMKPTLFFHAVQRTAQMVEHLRQCLACGFGVAPPAPFIHRSDYWVERILACLALVQGKAEYQDTLYLVRERHPGTDSWEDVRNRFDTFDWITSSSFSNALDTFCACVCDALARQEGIRVEEARAAIRPAIWWHFTHALVRSWNSRYGRRVAPWRNRLRAWRGRMPASYRGDLTAIRTIVEGNGDAEDARQLTGHAP